MFSQVIVILSPNGRGEVGNTNGQPPPPLGPGLNIYPPLPPGTRSEHLPPPPPPPGIRSEHLSPPPGSGQNISPPPQTRSEYLPPPPGLGPGQNIYPSPPPEHLTTPSPLGLGQDIYPLPPSGTRTSTPPPRDYTQAGGTHPTGMHSCWQIFSQW